MHQFPARATRRKYARCQVAHKKIVGMIQPAPEHRRRLAVVLCSAQNNDHFCRTSLIQLSLMLYCDSELRNLVDPDCRQNDRDNG